MNFSITNKLKLLSERLEEKIVEAAGDVEGAVNDLERELAEVRHRQDQILERLEEIARRLGPSPSDDDKRCGCGAFPCSCGEH